MSRLKIPAEVAKSGILRTNLYGVATMLKREFALKDVPLSLDDKVKAQMENQNNVTYPYGYLVPSDMQLSRELYNLTAVRRFGARAGEYGATRNTSRVGFVFPVKVGVEFHVLSDDAMKAIHYAECFAILAAMQNILTFDVRYGQRFSLNTRLEIPDSVTIPFADTGDTTKPGAVELVMQLIVHTYAGFFYDKASIYADGPVIGTAVEEDGELSEFSEVQPWLPEEYRNELDSNQ